MSVWKKTKLMLGLAADEEYDDGYGDGDYIDGGVDDRAAEPVERVAMHRPHPSAVRPTSASAAGPQRRPARPEPAPHVAANQRSGGGPGPSQPAQRSVVRPIPPAATAKPVVITPSSFNEAQQIGDRYKAKQPVIMNIQELDRDLSRRLIDFASGLCYGLGGRMEKVADHVYMLSPDDVEVSAEERQRLRDRGLYDE